MEAVLFINCRKDNIVNIGFYNTRLSLKVMIAARLSLKEHLDFAPGKAATLSLIRVIPNAVYIISEMISVNLP